MDCRISPTSWLKLSPQDGAVPIITIRSGEDVSKMTIALPMSPEVLPSMAVLLTYQGVLDTHTPPNTASAMISFVTGIRIMGGVNLISTIPWSTSGLIGGDKTGMVR